VSWLEQLRTRSFSWEDPAEGHVVHAGRRTATAEGRLFAQADGRLIAHASTGCLILR
jgi:acyl-coenzyme A thioesterase PaaI-like protein